MTKQLKLKSPNLEFQIALNYLLERAYKGQQAWVAKQARVSTAFLSTLKNGSRVASAHVQVRIAKALNKSYEEMLALGRAIRGPEGSAQGESEQKTPENCTIVINDPHKNLIENFIDKETAYQVNKKLLILERENPDQYKYLVKIIDIFFTAFKKEKLEEKKAKEHQPI